MLNASIKERTRDTPESSEDEDVLDLADDEGWEDVERDTEYITFCCMICGHHCNEMKHIVRHLRVCHDLDLPEIQSRLGMYSCCAQ